MTIDKPSMTNIPTRQKVILVITVLVFAIVVWQIVGLFKGDHATSTGSVTPMVAANGNPMPNAQAAPKPVTLDQPTTATQPASELAKLQQAMQDQYVAALNELQMLKLTQQIAATNKEIATSQLDTVKAKKEVVDLLAPPATSAANTPFASTISTTSSASAAQGGGLSAGYTVLSVSQSLNTWQAVLSSQGKLYTVGVGDTLPTDQSRVISIDHGGVVLEKNGAQQKISLIPVTNG